MEFLPSLFSVVSLDLLLFFLIIILFFSLLWQAVEWLKKVYGSEPIPDFQVNERTVDFLYNLAECSEARESDAALQIENMKQEAAEYEAKEELTLFTSFFCAINDMTSELYATESKNRETEWELTSMKEKLTAAMSLEQQLKEDLKNTEEYLEAEKLKARLRSQKIEFLKNKSKDLVIRIKAAEEQLAASGLDPLLTHESLVNLSEEVAKLQEETVYWKKQLVAYLDLPLSIPLAKVKVEEAKRELNAVEEELSKEIEKLTLEMQPPRK
ncbi:haus augmin-like complex subunit 1 [Limosa lapponica baueri]|uniref:Haus augmin-like complex subunit 1 n=1 Tax=Limosa lapponica baueri TaxID=1758121 RepID=A0A2I0T8L6_LIMLA|nr:haus augmin-like complex subunit 1 [Limosa lapponica baueri]